MNLVYVESPFQILCAVEALAYFGLMEEKVVVVIKFSKFLRSNNQMLELSKRFEFEKVIFLSNPFANTLNDTMMLFLIAKWKMLNTKFDFLFFGEVKNTTTRVVLANLKYKDYFFLDDGISTLEVQRRLQQGIDVASRSYSNSFLARVNTILEKAFFLTRNTPPKINWFTCFEIKKMPDQRIIRHRFNSIRNYFVDSKKTGNTLFIGSPISEDKKVNESCEVAAISRAVNFLSKGETIIYCAHRRESKEKIGKISELGNVVVHESQYPLELELLVIGMNRIAIASFFSTALHTLPLIYDIVRVDMFGLNESDLSDSFKETYRSILKESSVNKNIRVIKEY